MKPTPVRRLAFGALLIAAVLVGARRGAARAEARRPLSPLRVVGRQVVDAKNRRVRLRGVNAASLEWTSDGEGHILETVRVAIEDWHCTVIRLPLSQDRWFGKGPEQKDDGVAYRALVKQVVDRSRSGDCYVILDLHWSDAGQWGKLIGQHKMPDENSIAFWKACAAAYKNDPAVLFDLYNEPHDVTWDAWRNGGAVTERDRRTGVETAYLAVGMQAMLDAVRSTGARNVVVVGGLDWSYDLSGGLAGGPLKDDRGAGLIYANHAYPFKGETVEKWVARMERNTEKLPVIVSEFGSDPKGGAGETGEQWVSDVLKAIHDHDWDFTAWDMHPSAGPDLIIDWNYVPTLHFGRPVKAALAPNPPPPAGAGTRLP